MTRVVLTVVARLGGGAETTVAAAARVGPELEGRAAQAVGRNLAGEVDETLAGGLGRGVDRSGHAPGAHQRASAAMPRPVARASVSVSGIAQRELRLELTGAQGMVNDLEAAFHRARVASPARRAEEVARHVRESPAFASAKTARDVYNALQEALTALGVSTVVREEFASAFARRMAHTARLP